jgi:hypothetical protein
MSHLNKYLPKSIVLILGVLMAFNSLATSALAASPGISLQISPLPIQLNAKPGSSISTDLRVRNAGSQTEQLQVRLLRVSADDAGNVHLAAPKPSDPWVNWVHFSKNVFTAPPGEWQTIKMNVDLPKSAAFGYYFAVEYLRAQTEAPVPGAAAAHGAVATFILLNAEAPGASRQAQITSFSADKKTYEFLPATFTVKVHSAGNVHVAPHGNIFIMHGSKQIGTINVNAAQSNILPNSSRYFAASWSDGFPVRAPKLNGDQPVLDKNGNPKTSLKWDFSKANRLRFGHYTAHLVMIYDNGSRDVPMDAYVSFWVVPWRIIGVLLIILILVAVGLWSLLGKTKRFVRRHGSKKGETSD